MVATLTLFPIMETSSTTPIKLSNPLSTKVRAKALIKALAKGLTKGCPHLVPSAHMRIWSGTVFLVFALLGTLFKEVNAIPPRH